MTARVGLLRPGGSCTSTRPSTRCPCPMRLGGRTTWYLTASLQGDDKGELPARFQAASATYDDLGRMGLSRLGCPFRARLHCSYPGEQIGSRTSLHWVRDEARPRPRGCALGLLMDPATRPFTCRLVAQPCRGVDRQDSRPTGPGHLPTRGTLWAVVLSLIVAAQDPLTPGEV